MSQSATRPSAEEAAVRDVYEQLMRAWNRGSGAEFAAVFTEDGDLVGFDGTHLKGRREIGPFQQRLFDRWLKGTRLVGQFTGVRFLGPDTAVLHALGGTIMRGKQQRAPERDSIMTLGVARLAPGRVLEHPASDHGCGCASLPGVDAVRLAVEGVSAEQAARVFGTMTVSEP